MIFLFPLPVSKTASGESGQNNSGLVRGKGIGTFAEVAACVSEAGQKIPARGSDRFAGQRHCAQRSLFADLIFCYFLIKQKVVASAAIERADDYSDTLSMRDAFSHPIIANYDI